VIRRFGLLSAILGCSLAGKSSAAELDLATADRFAKLALACIDRAYPNKPEHTIDTAADVRSPQEFHPAFFGCFDWHSSVHGHWMLVRLLRLYPDLPSAPEIRARLDAHLSSEPLAAETRYMERASARSFERPYGWAWTLKLVSELEGWEDPQGKIWRERVRSLEKMVVQRLSDYLPKLTNPVRTGVHPNTAFALAEALDYARRMNRKDLESLAINRSRDYFAADRSCPLAYEPSGEDFFSPCLEEADLMRRVLSGPEFSKWLSRFWPDLSGRSSDVLSPAVVTDPTDPKLVHLDGLNLTRAWTLAGIARALDPKDPRRRTLEETASVHKKAGLVRVSSGNYEGEHWLASFAVYLLTDAGGSREPFLSGSR
jgi:hypothetical protein